MYAYGFPNQS
ncbi:MAG: hypothetical protein EZS28_048465, partial [Streblomastix strix]